MKIESIKNKNDQECVDLRNSLIEKNKREVGEKTEAIFREMQREQNEEKFRTLKNRFDNRLQELDSAIEKLLQNKYKLLKSV